MQSSHIPMRQLFTLFGGALIALLATAAVILAFDQSIATANNPSTSVLGTAGIDPAEAPPAGVLGDSSTPVSETLEANGLYYLAGDFSEVGGEPRTNLAAIDVATGHVDPTFAPVISNPGGGNFTVDGLSLIHI